MRKLIQSAVVMGALLYAFTSEDSGKKKKLQGKRGKIKKEKRNPG